MDFWRLIKLYSECYKLAGVLGLHACNKYVCGYIVLPDLDSISSDFPVGGSDA